MKGFRGALLLFLGAIFAPVAAAAEPAAPAPEKVIKLTFFGTGAPRPSPDRHGPSILVEAGSRRILIDAGPGVRQRMFEAGGFGLLTTVTDIFITHLHYDHVAGVADLWITGWMYGRKKPLRVFGPPGTAEFVDGLRRAYRWDIAYRQIVGIPSPGSPIEPNEIGTGVVFDEDGVKITAFKVAHMPIIPGTNRVVVQNFVGDVHACGNALTDGQDATVKISAIANVGKHMFFIAEVLLANPRGTLTAHLRKANGAAVHPNAHKVAANARHGPRAFGNFCAGVVGTTRAEPRHSVCRWIENQTVLCALLGVDGL